MTDVYPTAWYPDAHWTPDRGDAPFFQPFRSTDTTSRILTETQVALHKLKSEHRKLQAENESSNQNWAKAKKQMEDQMRQMEIQAREAQKAYEEHLARISAACSAAEDQCAQAKAANRVLQERLEKETQRMQDEIAKLQEENASLAAENKTLREKAAMGERSAQRAAQLSRRTEELEGAMREVQAQANAALKKMQKQLVAEMEKRRRLEDEVERLANLARTRGAEAEAAKAQSVQLAAEVQRLIAALEIERAINAPLRHQGHAGPTLTSMMRSPAGPAIAEHSRSPFPASIPQAPPSGQGGAISLSDDVIRVGRPNMSTALKGTQLTRLGRANAVLIGAAPLIAPGTPQRGEQKAAGAGGSSPRDPHVES